MRLTTIAEQYRIRYHTIFEVWEWTKFRAFCPLDPDINHDNVILAIL